MMVPVVRVIQPVGTLDSQQANLLRQEIQSIIEEGVKTVLIDLQEVVFMDSSGLAAIVLAMKMLKEVEGKLFVCSVNEQIKMLFELTRIDMVLDIFISQEEFSRMLLSRQEVTV